MEIAQRFGHGPRMERAVSRVSHLRIVKGEVRADRVVQGQPLVRRQHCRRVARESFDGIAEEAGGRVRIVQHPTVMAANQIAVVQQEQGLVETRSS